MAANVSISAQERKELERYIRFFVYKSVQIIVQSRLGERIRTECRNIVDGSDWFNLGIKDKEDILRETKKCIADVHFLASNTINVEISLKTTEGDEVVLEVWSINYDTSKRQNPKICFTVYNWLGTLLKSLLCITRIVNGYRLSRTQSTSSHAVIYQIYLGQPNLSQFGGKEQKLNIGSVPTPMGSVTLDVFQRTQMMMEPGGGENDLDLKENYFTFDSQATPAHRLSNVLGQRHINHQNSSDDMEGIAAHAYTGQIPSSPRFRDQSNVYLAKDSPQNKIFRLGGSSSENTDSSGSGPNTRPSEKTRKVGAFVPRRDSQLSFDEEVPFSTLLQMSHQETTLPSEPQEFSDLARAAVTQSVLDDPDFVDVKADEEFCLLNVDTPFAVPDTETDLGRFYRSCEAHRSLELFTHGLSISDTIATFDVQAFENRLAEFDEFVNDISVYD